MPKDTNGTLSRNVLWAIAIFGMLVIVLINMMKPAPDVKPAIKTEKADTPTAEESLPAEEQKPTSAAEERKPEEAPADKAAPEKKEADSKKPETVESSDMADKAQEKDKPADDAAKSLEETKPEKKKAD